MVKSTSIQSIDLKKYNNHLYIVKFVDTCRQPDIIEDVVVKNTPFLISITAKPDSSTIPNDQEIKEGAVKVNLVYDNDVDTQVTCRSSKSYEYNTYVKDGTMTIETRIHVLSSKQENTLFRLTVEFNQHILITDALRCVSKLDTKKKKINTPTPIKLTKRQQQQKQQPSSPSITVPSSPETNNESSSQHPLSSPQIVLYEKKSNKRKETEPSSSTTLISSSSQDEGKLKRVKRQQKKDRELISLLYKQNIMLVNQVNVLTNGLNKLISVHNDNLLTNAMPTTYSVDPNTTYSPASPISSSIPSSPVIVPNQAGSNLSSSSSSYPSINPDVLETIGLSNTDSGALSGSSSSNLPTPTSFEEQPLLTKAQSAIPTSSSSNGLGCVVGNSNDFQVIQMSDLIGASNYLSSCHSNTPYSHSFLDLNLDFNVVDFNAAASQATMSSNSVPEYITHCYATNTYNDHQLMLPQQQH